jgi:hypothetical protein
MNDKYDSFTKVESFRKNGFIIIPGVLHNRDVDSKRDVLNNIMRTMPKEKSMLVFSDIFGNNNLLDFLIEAQYNNKIINTLSQIFKNEFYYINDIQIQCNMFGINLGGWHTDSGSEVSLNSGDYLHFPDYSFGKVGVYLQDNTINFGGGIDVIPKSHKIYKYFKGNKLLQYFYARLAGKILRYKDAITKLTVPVKAGDAIFFDSRTIHRSSLPQAMKSEMNKSEIGGQRVTSLNIKPKNSKYALYWDVGSKEDSLRFLRNSCKRAMMEEMMFKDNIKELFFTDYLQYTYPDDYPSKYKKNVNKFPQLNIRSLNKIRSKLFKSLF